MRKELGGDRLGSGNKMSVDMRTYDRSNHDLSFVWRNTQAPGTIVPFLCKVGLPGDTWNIGLDCNVMTHPTLGPLFGSFKVQLDVFEIPMRLYNKLLINDTANIGNDVSQILFPEMTLFTTQTLPTSDNDQINPSSIFAYLGIRGLGTQNGAESIQRTFNAIPWIGYWDIVKNYFANKQETNMYVVHTDLINYQVPITEVAVNTQDGWQAVTEYPTTHEPPYGQDSGRITFPDGSNPTQDQIDAILWYGARYVDGIITPLHWQDIWKTATITGTVTPIVTFTNPITYTSPDGTSGVVGISAWYRPLPNPEDDLEPKLMAFPLTNIDRTREDILAQSKTSPFSLNHDRLTPFSQTLTSGLTTHQPMEYAQEGLAVKTYQSDINNNWLKTEWIDAINNNTRVDTSAGSFSIDQLLLSRKIFDLNNRIAMSGGSWEDYLEVVYTNSTMRRATTPIYQGGLSKELVFQEVVSTATAQDATGTPQPLGQLAGRGVLAKKHKGGQIRIKVNEPCYIMGVVSLTPRLDYSQGNEWDVNLKTMADLHVPGLDAIGFQDRITDEMAWWDTEIDTGDNTPVFKSAGKQPAWINYMTSVNKALGNFAIQNNEMFMTLNRRYQMNRYGTLPSIKDLTTYIDPANYNFIFADTRRDAMNFWVQIAVNAEVRRVMSAKVIPNL